MPTDNAGLVARVLRREGEAYVQEPKTCSRYGVTREALQDWRGVAQTCDDVRALTRDEATGYYLWLLDQTRIAQITDVALRETVFDAAVNSGPGRAIRWLQREALVDDDGVIGPETLRAVSDSDAGKVRAGVVRRRLAFLGAIISQSPARYGPYAEAWLVRVGEFVR